VQASRQISNLRCTYRAAAGIENAVQHIDFQRIGRKNDRIAPKIGLRRLLLFAVTLRRRKFESSECQTANAQTPNCELFLVASDFE
jgi:hypothetical protein